MYTKYEENPFAGFFNTTIVGKISRNFSMGPLFSKFDWWMPMTWGCNPYLNFGSNTYFLRLILIFSIANCSQSLDSFKNACK